MNRYYYQPIKDGRTHWGNRGWTAGLCQKGTVIECHVARQYDCPGIGIPESIFPGRCTPPSYSIASLCPARSAKYERISLSKVGARQCDKSNTADDCQNKPQPPEQQADEARFRLQNVVTRPSGRRECESAPPPIHTVQLAVATEATPLSAVDTEAPP